METGKYGVSITVGGPFAEAVARAKEAFKAEGFGTLTEIDVKCTLNEKIGAEIEPYTILGVCNPKLASRAIALEHEIGLMLPCNVLVHECGGAVRVAVQDPRMMAEATGNPALAPFAEEAREMLLRALDRLAA